MVHRLGSDVDVEIAYDLALSPEIAPDAREPLHDAAAEGQYLHSSQKLAEACFRGLRIFAEVDAFVDLAKGDEADRQAIWRERRQQARGVSSSFEIVNATRSVSVR